MMMVVPCLGHVFCKKRIQFAFEQESAIVRHRLRQIHPIDSRRWKRIWLRTSRGGT
jgi:hypothetical protein